MSGKGGVGKSSVTALLGGDLTKKGYQVGILDADITGPSIPKMFGIHAQVDLVENFFLPPEKHGIKMMSVNFLLGNENDPVIWRSPVIIRAVKDFWVKCAWGDLDYLLIDLPPGTGDVPLTVMQSIPLQGMIVVSSPHDVTVMIVKKAIQMAKKVGIPVLALVENMSYFSCPCCGQTTPVFGKSKVREVAQGAGIPLTAVLPLDPCLAMLQEEGKIFDYSLKEDLSALLGRREEQK
ncbi:ATP-binding protein [Candidatus Formimonas warabiya]|uniref:Iron-sulfur cluster carrier protein n=2 Tax=Formimonas warabiya TaxID=1761012 RepID=A0A3G1L2F6_FORW1|nr:ATP-binding protein [Candidatus Formimonas warabiya]